ncbi:MAG: response regulator [Candidatus Omnitrophota bacterium]
MSEKKILVIDDEDFIRELVKDFLELEGVQCQDAETLNEAMKLLETETFDLILLDRNLGEIRTEDFIPELKKKSRNNVPILLLTGDQLDYPLLKGVGANGIIFKPFQVSDFLDTIHKYLENQ